MNTFLSKLLSMNSRRISSALILALVLMAGVISAPVSARQSKSKAKAKPKTVETSRDVRRQQEATQQDIKQTKQQIQQNDLAVKRSLSELGRIEGDISESKKKVAATGARVRTLNTRISTLQTQIAADEKTLSKLRSEYLKAVKKMRTKRKEKSMLAFIFSSGNFNEAVRRMRYLKQFSKWRQDQTEAINAHVQSLKQNTTRLAQTQTPRPRARRADQGPEESRGPIFQTGCNRARTQAQRRRVAGPPRSETTGGERTEEPCVRPHR